MASECVGKCRHSGEDSRDIFGRAVVGILTVSGSSVGGVDDAPRITRGGRHAPTLGKGTSVASSFWSASSGDALPIVSHVRSVTPYDRRSSADIS